MICTLIKRVHTHVARNFAPSTASHLRVRCANGHGGESGGWAKTYDVSGCGVSRCGSQAASEPQSLRIS
jgi:hypothetical protein